MNNAVITLKTEAELKEKAMKLADELGFSLSSLINAYLKHFVRTKEVSFNLQPEGEPTDWMIKQLKESKKEIKEGKYVSFNTEKEALNYLRSLIDKNEDRLRKKVSKTAKKGTVKYTKSILPTIGAFSA